MAIAAALIDGGLTACVSGAPAVTGGAGGCVDSSVPIANGGLGEPRADPGAGETDSFHSGRGHFTFDQWEGPPITVFYAAPHDVGPDTPIVFVHHGACRNAHQYRDAWAGLATQFDILVVAPHFSRDQFPKARAYNLGGVFDESGRPRPQDTWTFAAIEPLFDDVVVRAGSDQTGYSMFGHSAGSQFVHRFAMHEPNNRAHTIVLANAGWYTLPTATAEWPYGLAGALVSNEAVVAFLEKRVIVLLGEDDVDQRDTNLRRSREAMAQGPHRLARGYTFFRAAVERAAAEGVIPNWSLKTVPGVGHDNAAMAPPAARALMDANAAETQNSGDAK